MEAIPEKGESGKTAMANSEKECACQRGMAGGAGVAAGVVRTHGAGIEAGAGGAGADVGMRCIGYGLGTL